MDCCDVVNRPHDKQILHLKFILKRKSYESERVVTHEALSYMWQRRRRPWRRLASLVIDFSIKNLLFSIAKHMKWVVRRLALQNTFPIGMLGRSLYIEVPNCIRSGSWDKNKVFKLIQSLYGLKEEAKVWYQIIITKFGQLNFNELDRALSVFQSTNMRVVCFVDDLSIFAADDTAIEKFKVLISWSSVTNHLGRPR